MMMAVGMNYNQIRGCWYAGNGLDARERDNARTCSSSDGDRAAHAGDWSLGLLVGSAVVLKENGEMKRPDRVTVTTFWFDWLLLPIMLGAGWLTLRWASADFDLAASPGTWGGTLPAWVVSIPLMLCAVGWVILGFGSLIREEYWEHRIWCAILILWSLALWDFAWEGHIWGYSG